MRVVSFFSGIGGLDKGFEVLQIPVIILSGQMILISMQYRHIKQTMKMR